MKTSFALRCLKTLPFHWGTRFAAERRIEALGQETNKRKKYAAVTQTNKSRKLSLPAACLFRSFCPWKPFGKVRIEREVYRQKPSGAENPVTSVVRFDLGFHERHFHYAGCKGGALLSFFLVFCQHGISSLFTFFALTSLG